MKERGILFSAPMVRAILAGTKTVTRRIVNPQPHRVDKKILNAAEPGDDPVLVTRPEGWEWKDLYVADAGGRFAEALALYCPYGEPGDRLWVKETHGFVSEQSDADPRRAMADAKAQMPWASVAYRSDAAWTKYTPEKWRPSIFMPRWASRITLEVVSVRVERLHEITEEDAAREGVDPFRHPSGATIYRDAFALLWDDINGERLPFDENPFVWRVEFKRVEQSR